MRDPRRPELVQLLRAAGPAHHHAFLATDGADLEWPLWYADYLYEAVKPLLSAALTKSELVYWLVRLDREHRQANAGQPWPEFYADILLEQYPA